MADEKKKESEAEVGAGDVEVTLTEDGVSKKFKLRCTLGAAMALSKQHGGLVGAMNRCLNYDMDALVSVYAAGLGKNSAALPKAIYDEGVAKCSVPAVKFITNLTYGGRQPPKKVEGEDPLGEPEEGTAESL